MATPASGLSMGVIHSFRNTRSVLNRVMGRQVKRATLFAILVGILWFAVEVYFIQVLQIFLRSIGVKFNDFGVDLSFIPLDFTNPLMACLLLVAYGALRATLVFFKSFLSIYAQHLYIREHREKLFKLAMNNAGQIPTDSVLGVFTEVISQGGAVANQLAQLTVAVVCTTLLVFYGFALAWREMVFALLALGFLLIPLFLVNRHIARLGDQMLIQWQKISESLLDGIKNNFILKVYSLIEAETRRGYSMLKNYEEIYRSYSKYISLNASLPIFLGVTIVSSVSFLSVTRFETKASVLLGFVYVFIRLAQSAGESFHLLASAKMSYPSMIKLANLYDDYSHGTVTDLDSPKSGIGHAVASIEHIQLKNLSFAYSGYDPLFSNLNYSLRRGDVLLIKGPSGCGKSTLLKVALGLLRPTSGNVAINDIANVDLALWAHKIGYVGPNPYLVKGSVLENLQYANNNQIDSKLAWETLRKTELSVFFEENGIGLNSYFTEESFLSTGQRQRLAMARAWLRLPDVLILDEATANVDHDTERKIVAAVKEMFADRIVFVISHKDSFDDIATKTIDFNTRNRSKGAQADHQV